MCAPNSLNLTARYILLQIRAAMGKKQGNATHHLSGLIFILLIYLSPRCLFALTDAEINEIIAGMTVAEKVGQLVMAGFDSVEANREITTHITERFIGGVILLGRNVQSPQQVAQLTNRLQELAQQTRHRVPLLVAADQEGGPITRIKKGATVFPGAMALGATDSTELAEMAGAVTAVELAAIGVNLNLAPVMDVNTNPRNPVINRRAFGDSADLVSRLGGAYIQGLQKGGVLATAKHFPGHGDAAIDSHWNLPMVAHDLERLKAVELKPFRAAIAAGVAAIMTAHIVYPAFDSDRPATLSHTILTHLLRRQLGFEGLIITDDMEMKAIDGRYRLDEAAVMAVEAGADVILVPGAYEKQIKVYEALLSAAAEGRMTTDRLNQSVRRILKSKQACGAFDRQFVDVDKVGEVVGQKSHKQLAQEIAARAVTVVQNSGELIPLALDAETSLLVVSPLDALVNLLQQSRANTAYIKISGQTYGAETLNDLIAQANRADVVIAGITTARQAALMQRMSQATKTPVIVIAFASPYHLQRCPTASASIAAYDSHDASVLAAVEVILGQRRAQGKLPVHIAQGNIQ
jgi:beta-N-acetylhexosaminidase